MFKIDLRSIDNQKFSFTRIKQMPLALKFLSFEIFREYTIACLIWINKYRIGHFPLLINVMCIKSIYRCNAADDVWASV